MASRPLTRILLAGAATAALTTTTTALANGWDGMVVFGSRNYDEGQYPSHDAVYSGPDAEIGDGRQRATSEVWGGVGLAPVIPQLVARSLGFGDLNPSQPSSHGDRPAPPDGTNYASMFYGTADVLDSIEGTARNGSIFYEDRGVDVEVPGRSRPGFLVDPDRKGSAWGALVLLDGGTRDLRQTADIYRDLDSRIDLDASRIVLDPNERDAIASWAADNIVQGADALAQAGAGLIVVSNAYDVGRIPEITGDIDLLSQADSVLETRRFEASSSEFRAQQAEADARQARADGLAIADQMEEAARLARIEADSLALTADEIALAEGVDAALTDTTLLATIRTAATDTYNARLMEGLKQIDGNIVLLDQRALFEEIIADPARFGFEPQFDQSKDCDYEDVLFSCSGNANVDDDKILFTNGVELSETGHEILADQIVALVSAPGALSGIPSVALSSGRGVADAGRDQVSREQTMQTGLAPFLGGGWAHVELTDSEDFPENQATFYSGIAGLKYVLANGIALGVAGAYQDITSPGDQSTVDYDGSGLFGTAFAGINSGPVFGNVTATYGKVDYDALSRVSKIGPTEFRNSAQTEGTVTGLTAEAGLRLLQYKALRGGPVANFAHWSSEVDGFEESGWEATAVRTEDFEATSTRAGVGVFLEAGTMTDGYGSVFRGKLLYSHEFADETREASVTPVGPNAVGTYSAQVRNADKAPLELGAEIVTGYRGLMTTFGYNGLFGDLSDHRFRITASYPLGG